MIYVTRLNHTPVVLNCDLIEHMETTPDTVISLTTGQKFMVLESAEEIIDRVVQFRHLILNRTAANPQRVGLRQRGHPGPTREWDPWQTLSARRQVDDRTWPVSVGWSSRLAAS
jgi:flagellar protein FlbD